MIAIDAGDLSSGGYCASFRAAAAVSPELPKNYRLTSSICQPSCVMAQMMASGFVAMKTDRAKKHLDNFNRLVADFLPKSVTVTTRDNTQMGCCIRRTQFHSWPPEIGMVLGEFVYSLRSGLEQLAWNLATPEARANSSKDVCFPIVEGTNNQARRNLRETLRLFPSDVAKEIDAVQPNRGPGKLEDHPLWQLKQLSNLDKHCLIPVNGRAKDIFVPPIEMGGRHIPLPDEEAVEVYVPLANKHYFNFDPDTPPKVILGEWESDLCIPIHRLADIYGFIACTVIPSFLKVDRPAPLGGRVKFGKVKPVTA